ncbi:unnamed protein product [Urochloa humidicola]
MEAARSRLFILLILSIVLYLAVISNARKSGALAGPASEPRSSSPPASPTGQAIHTPPHGSHSRVPSLPHSIFSEKATQQGGTERGCLHRSTRGWVRSSGSEVRTCWRAVGCSERSRVTSSSGRLCLSGSEAVGTLQDLGMGVLVRRWTRGAGWRPTAGGAEAGRRHGSGSMEALRERGGGGGGAEACWELGASDAAGPTDLSGGGGQEGREGSRRHGGTWAAAWTEGGEWGAEGRGGGSVPPCLRLAGNT